MAGVSARALLRAAGRALCEEAAAVAEGNSVDGDDQHQLLLVENVARLLRALQGLGVRPRSGWLRQACEAVAPALRRLSAASASSSSSPVVVPLRDLARLAGALADMRHRPTQGGQPQAAWFEALEAAAAASLAESAATVAGASSSTALMAAAERALIGPGDSPASEAAGTAELARALALGRALARLRALGAVGGAAPSASAAGAAPAPASAQQQQQAPWWPALRDLTLRNARALSAAQLAALCWVAAAAAGEEDEQRQPQPQQQQEDALWLSAVAMRAAELAAADALLPSDARGAAATADLARCAWGLAAARVALLGGEAAATTTAPALGAAAAALSAALERRMPAAGALDLVHAAVGVAGLGGGVDGGSSSSFWDAHQRRCAALLLAPGRGREADESSVARSNHHHPSIVEPAVLRQIARAYASAGVSPLAALARAFVAYA